jgi:hypothetical protein
VTRFEEKAVWFEFTSDRFDHASELPAEANAGNRFYGRDVAEFLSTGLGDRGFDASHLDEDWGWQVHAKRPDESVLEVSIYHNPDDDPDAENDWAIMLRSLHKERKLGIVTRFRESEVDDDAIATLDDVFRQSGIELKRTPAR